MRTARLTLDPAERDERERDEEELAVLALADAGLSFDEIADEAGLPYWDVIAIISAVAPARVMH